MSEKITATQDISHTVLNKFISLCLQTWRGRDEWSKARKAPKSVGCLARRSRSTPARCSRMMLTLRSLTLPIYSTPFTIRPRSFGIRLPSYAMEQLYSRCHGKQPFWALESTWKPHRTTSCFKRTLGHLPRVGDTQRENFTRRCQNGVLR